MRPTPLAVQKTTRFWALLATFALLLSLVAPGLTSMAFAAQVTPFPDDLQNGSFETTPSFNTTDIPNNMINNGFANAGRNWAQWNQSRVYGWSTTATDSRIEIWHGPFTPNIPSGITFSASDGSQFAEINGTEQATLYQDLATRAGSLYRWSVDHRGRSGVDTANVLLNSVVQYSLSSPPNHSTTMASGNRSWTNYDGFYTATATATRFALQAVSESGGDPRMGNMVDNITWARVADPTEQTIWQGDNLHDGSARFDSLITWVTNTWGLTAAPQDPAFDPSSLGPGDYDIPLDIKDTAGNVVGQITSIVHVLAATPPPVATDDSFSTPINTAITGNILTGDNGNGLDSGTNIVVITTTVTTTNGVTVTIDPDGTFTYTPPAGWTGVDSFDYTIEQDDGQQATATVTITITAAEDIDPLTETDPPDTDDPPATPPTGDSLGLGGLGAATLLLLAGGALVCQRQQKLRGIRP